MQFRAESHFATIYDTLARADASVGARRRRASRMAAAAGTATAPRHAT